MLARLPGGMFWPLFMSRGATKSCHVMISCFQTRIQFSQHLHRSYHLQNFPSQLHEWLVTCTTRVDFDKKLLKKGAKVQIDVVWEMTDKLNTSPWWRQTRGSDAKYRTFHWLHQTQGVSQILGPARKDFSFPVLYTCKTIDSPHSSEVNVYYMCLPGRVYIVNAWQEESGKYEAQGWCIVGNLTMWGSEWQGL